MIGGVVTPDLHIRIPVQLISMVAAGDVDAILDTGFDGHLTLPAAKISELDLKPQGITEAQLGDGSIVLLRKFLAEVRWHGRPRAITVLESPSLPLMGIGLLEGAEIWVQVHAGGLVRITESGE